jgi:hypothetical protein
MRIETQEKQKKISQLEDYICTVLEPQVKKAFLIKIGK